MEKYALIVEYICTCSPMGIATWQSHVLLPVTQCTRHFSETVTNAVSKEHSTSMVTP